MFFADVGETFCHQDHLVSRNVICFQGLGNDLLRMTIAVNIGSVPSIQTTVISCFQQRKSLASWVLVEECSNIDGVVTDFVFIHDP